MEIGEFSQRTEITIDTLRYYNKIGLIVPNRINNRRWYTEKDLEKANIIIKLKNMNFTLEEIQSLFDLDKNINESEKFTEDDIDKIYGCLNIIEDKYNYITKRKKDLIQIKAVLENMINKTKKLIETGFLPDKVSSNCNDEVNKL